jgi:heme O synthase-like polyprenyltransferase
LAEARPAFYALAPGGLRDYVTLLHPPYTAWHLSYVAVGAALAPELALDRLGATLAAFFLAMGIGAHALDELVDRPLQTRIRRRTLAVLGGCAIAAAIAIGIWALFWINPWLAPFVAFGSFIAVAYNLELGGPLFHNGFWFAVAWGGFPVLTGYFAQAETIRVEAGLAAAFACVLSHVQRRLSTPVRLVRRRVRSVSGTIELADGGREQVTPESLMGAPEAALRALSAATCLLAAALVVARL